MKEKEIKEKTIGEKISPILCEIEKTLWEFEANDGGKPNYPIEAFRAATKIFLSVLLDKMYNLQENEGMSLENRKAGQGKCLRHRHTLAP